MPKFIESKENPRYSVDWMEEWGLDSIYCGEDLEKAKNILIGKHAEGYNAWIDVTTEHTIQLDDEETDGN